MALSLKYLLSQGAIAASAPVRLDLGGTLDIGTFSLPLASQRPCTFVLALGLRTRVRLSPFRDGWVRVRSRGFADAAYPLADAPFRDPMGLMFAVAAHFDFDGVDIAIESASPPRSALGGSSAAAVALIAAIDLLQRRREGSRPMTATGIALLAHRIEAGVAGVACGFQDQLAAAFGGVHAWYWQAGDPPFQGEALFSPDRYAEFERHLLVAYCGTPHDSVDVNGRWLRGFLDGRERGAWREILDCTHGFIDAIKSRDFAGAVHHMNRETEIRCRLTPEVLDDVGRDLVAAAVAGGCGARFTGAGGGGCVWALGLPEALAAVRNAWARRIAAHPSACLLETAIDPRGAGATRISSSRESSDERAIS